MDLSLSPDQEDVRKAVKAWVDDVVTPRALQNDREERFPQEALDGLRQTGFIGLTIPERTVAAAVTRCRTCCSSRSSVAVTPTCARSSASTSGSSPGRSPDGGPRSRRSSGCHGWPPVRCSAASA